MLRTVQTVPYKSGWCLIGSDHSRCTSGATTKVWSEKDNATISKTTTCVCMCHNGQKKCHLCGHISSLYADYDVVERRCLDRVECAERIEAHERLSQTTNPLIALIREVKELGKIERSTRNQLRATNNGHSNGDSDDSNGEPKHHGRKKFIPPSENVTMITIEGV